MSKLLDDIVGELSRLPGIGRRTALRLSMHILRMEPAQVGNMTVAIDNFRNKIKHCSLCNNLTDTEICPICADHTRDRSTICVVEQVGDVISIENTRQYRGLYHVLGGVISPMQGIGPSSLKIDLLLDRIAQGETDSATQHEPQTAQHQAAQHQSQIAQQHPPIKELILAISTTVEGETTLFYITRRLEQFSTLKITTLARGIGFGDEIEYADELTIAHAIHNRRGI